LGTVYQSKSKQKREKFFLNSKGKGFLARGKQKNGEKTPKPTKHGQNLENRKN
jgi:hypothetical protein